VIKPLPGLANNSIKQMKIALFRLFLGLLVKKTGAGFLKQSGFEL